VNTNKDTIAAISTPIGEGGIGIVRLSGQLSFNIVDKIFVSSTKDKFKSFLSHTVHYGTIENSGEVIDEVLITVMRAPKTYTTEDMIEINCHGGISCIKKVLEICLENGARLAEPGEFTKRAFLSGRIDLAKAEAVLEIIQSETDAARGMAIEHLRGDFSKTIYGIRDSVLDILSRIELEIDFSQEDVDFSSHNKIYDSLRKINKETENLIETYSKGLVLREGVEVVICGKPNVGKSSLMNALLKHDRVIVTPIAGTTRDVIEENINIGGIKVRVSDTAGIIETKDRVEIEGIKRSKKKLDSADIILFMLDYSKALSGQDKDIYEMVKDKKVIVLINKTDLAKRIDLKFFENENSIKEGIKISVLKKTGIEKIEDEILKRIYNERMNVPEGPVVSNIRHKRVLEDMRSVLARVLGSEESYNPELLASDLNEVIFLLGLITGESCDDEVLDRIFSQFCIGK